MEPYVELRCRSAFSFLEGASLPEALAQTAARLGMPALALTDRGGVYGAPRLHQAARRAGIAAIVGAEVPLVGGARLPLLVETRAGYQNLCRLLTRMHLRAPKGEGCAGWGDLEEFAGGLVCLTGADSGPLAAALRDRRGGEREARRVLERLAGMFGRENVLVEIQRHFRRGEEALNRAFLCLAAATGLPPIATNGVAYATAAERPIADVFTCLRHHCTLDTAGRLLAPNAERALKPPAAMARLFADVPGAVAASGALAARLGFRLDDLGYEFPRAPVPPGHTMTSYLRELTVAGALRRYGAPGTAATPARRALARRAWRQIEHELALIAKLRLEGYFLIVYDIIRYCREQGILAQGRGSAANSAVCYSLGITAVDPVGMELLFERFLSEERGEWPDIDIDLPSGERRERVIQYLYRAYGESGAAMTANVITYRGRAAAREVGKVLDFPPAAVERLAHALGATHPAAPGPVAPPHERLRRGGFETRHPRIEHFLRLHAGLEGLPRHLGQHSGGMVICQGRLDQVVPLENASMPGRVVVQWDKDDCADLGIIKVDLLGLGMMAVLEDALHLLDARSPARESLATLDLARFPPGDAKVYRMLRAADTIGVFQVESRAQMATLPRLRPETFYDLVVEVGLIRPGPIVGQMVHPYLQRRAGREPVSYPHPSLEPILKRTLGVPLFQEQLLRMAMAAAGFSGGEAEELRRIMTHKRPGARMSEVEGKLRQGMAERGITGAAAEAIAQAIASFALYGFPESHAASFALLVYASAYLKAHHPAEFYAALLNNQPMGFYHPATLIQDARRHDVAVLPIAVAESDWDCAVLPGAEPGVRLGLRYASGLREEVGRRMVAERRRAPFRSLDDLRRRTGLNRGEARLLAEIGALPDFDEAAAPELTAGLESPAARRAALWQVERAWRPAGALYEDSEAAAAQDAELSPLREMNAEERMLADYRGSGVTLGPHPFALRRAELRARGILTAAELRRVPDGRRASVAGLVIARQRPETARGIVFLSLEDETGIANIIVPAATFERQRLVCAAESALWIEGVLQNREGVVHLRAERIRPAGPAGAEALVPTYDFR
ncbi:MAG TPA: error-prone DNA polymerase [Terriglobales bacterium]|nr:error-prone DNA polymerase [Terriglobales bacterium]